MILFYDKDTGNIVGTIDGRVHNESHLNMWVGDEANTKRLIFNWESQGNNWVLNVPNEEQANIVMELEKHRAKLSKYKVDPQTEMLVVK